LSELRRQIDELDNQLLEVIAKRMRISREIGTYKKEHDMQILQTARYSEILDKRVSEAVKMGIDGECMQKIMEAIHEESIRQQMEVMNETTTN
jgi:chorismate mutase